MRHSGVNDFKAKGTSRDFRHTINRGELNRSEFRFRQI